MIVFREMGVGIINDEKRVGPPVEQILETEIDGEISLYNPKNEQVTVLNGTASDVWLLCDGEHTAGEIKTLLASSYALEPEEIADDVDRTIAMLEDSGLLA